MQWAMASLTMLLAATVARPAGAEAASAEGKATALNSDTLSIAGQVFRLDGIDGIDDHQFCFIDGQPWACGSAAVRSLQALVDPVALNCTPTGERDGEAELARCTAGGIDIGEILVGDGWALASDVGRYGEIEAGARIGRKGAWQGTFVEPWIHREDLAAIESRYLLEAPEALRRAAEEILTGSDGGIEVLSGFKVVEVPRDDQMTLLRTQVPDLPSGFIEDAIPDREVFAWRTVAQHVVAWQEANTSVVQDRAVAAIWAALLERPRRDLRVSDGEGYYAAMAEHAAPWIAQGRQPILLVASPLVPSWLVHWFDDEPPDGARVTRKSNVSSGSYLGTIDGVDVYVAPVSETVSALLPADLLAEVTYGQDGGAVLDVRRTRGSDPASLDVVLAMRLSWREDPMVWLHFPRAEAAVLDES